MFCKKCNCEKDADQFYVSNQTRCKECIKAAATKNRLDNLERARSYDRMRASMPHRVALRKEVVTKYVGQFPGRKKANTAVGNAIRDGRLKKQPCWVCGNTAVAHHPDYGRPLDVVWLCQPHHKQTHALVSNDYFHQSLEAA